MRSRFLPLFFTILAIAFVIALVVRLRSDMREAATTTISASRPTATTGAPPPGQTMTIVPASETVAGLTATREARASQAASSTATPAPPPPSTSTAASAATSSAQPRPSGLARVLAPIAKGFGAGDQVSKSASNPSASQPSPSTSQSQQSQGQSQSPQQQKTSTNGPDQEAAKDPNSDNTPPQLQSIEFVPPQIHDGEEASIIVTAVDDLSGIRGISGTVSSPTGKALQGFATQREGETNRYVGRVTIAKDAEEGLWKVNFLNMSDNASNSVTLSYAMGGVPQNAVLRVVSSNSDSTPPTLKNIWVDRRAIRGGEKDVVFIEATDDKSGVNLVSAVFQSPSKQARIGAGCQHGDGDVWRCELNVPTCIDCGDWQLEQVTLQDKANNLASFRMDNPLVQSVKINISGDACDNTPPVLQGLRLDTNQVDTARGPAVVNVTVLATDDNCGISGVSGQYVGPGPGSGGFFPFQSSDGSTWTGRIQLDPHAARGLWRINSIQLNDKGHNLRVYYANDPLLAGGVFQVR